MFSAPIGGGTITQLNGPLAVGEAVGFFQLSEDGSTVIYSTELFDDDVPLTGLYSVPINGGTVNRLSEPFAAGSGVFGYGISPDSSMVVYESDQETAGVRELYIVPIGGGTTTKLNGPLVSGGDVQHSEFSPNSNIVLYRADQDTDEKDELYSVRVPAPVDDETSILFFMPAILSGAVRK